MSKGKTTAATEHVAPGLRTMTVTVRSLTSDPDNARRHDARNLAAIAASLERFGQQAPIVYANRRGKRVVVKGNGLLAAARSLGWTHVAAIRSDLRDRALRAYAIADNRTGDLSAFDQHLLTIQLQELQDAEFGLDAVGFTDAELANLTAELETERTERPAAPGQDRRRRERTAGCTIGHLAFDVPRADFERWLAAVETKVGSDPDRLVAEIRRRLRL